MARRRMTRAQQRAMWAKRGHGKLPKVLSPWRGNLEKGWPDIGQITPEMQKALNQGVKEGTIEKTRRPWILAGELGLAGKLLVSQGISKTAGVGPLKNYYKLKSQEPSFVRITVPVENIKEWKKRQEE